LRLGAKRTDLILAGDFYRLIAPWWLHGGILHWVLNMLALINLGFSLEREFGTPKIAIIFCTCGFMGALCSAVFLPNVVGVGASGAIFGLFGACFADLIQNWGLYKSRGNAKTVLCQLVFGAILNFLLGFLPVLDQFAHLGGFFTGVERK
jgi:membrane associated rhomboid family serine protease